MKRLILAGLGVAALVGSGIAIAPSASASTVTPAAASFTLYENDNYGGGWVDLLHDDLDLSNNIWTNASGSADNGASSMKNNSGTDVVLYQNANFAGDNYFAKIGSVDADFSNNSFDNKASSVDWQ